MFGTRSTRSFTWISICLASILICLCIEAIPLPANTNTSPLDDTKPAATLTDTFNIDDVISLDSNSKNIVVRSADSDDNSVDDGDSSENKDDKTEKPHSDKSEEIFPSDNKHHPHPHGSHGVLGPIKHLINHLPGTQGAHSNGIGDFLGGMLGTHHRQNTEHESPIETEKDRTMINSSTGLHVLEFLGTIFGLVWGFLSNIPALFGSSSSSLSGGGQ